jgi:hypothetical protein
VNGEMSFGLIWLRVERGEGLVRMEKWALGSVNCGECFDWLRAC